jgi:hypothetical protein
MCAKKMVAVEKTKKQNLIVLLGKMEKITKKSKVNSVRRHLLINESMDQTKFNTTNFTDYLFNFDKDNKATLKSINSILTNI